MKKYSKYGSIKKFFHEYDLFKSPANLRFDQQPDVSQLCSGIFSLLLIAFFAYVLINQFVKVLRYQSIDYVETLKTETNLTLPSASNIRIAITPAWSTYETWHTMFEVNAYLVTKQNEFATPTITNITMERCQQSKWTNYSQIYRDLQFAQNTCIASPQDITISGCNFMDRQVSINLMMTRCTNSTPGCITNETEFNEKLQQLYKYEGNYLNFYIIDTSINADKENPVEEYIRMNYDFFYTNQTRLRVNVFLGMYVVETDNSLWPLSDAGDQISGYYVADKTEDEIDRVFEKALLNSDVFNQINIYVGNKKKVFTRTRGKLDTIVSYAGGLFGILIGIFAYFINSYNEYSYELRVAQSSFNYDQHGNQVKQKHFNFLKYIKFTVYDWVKFLFCYQIKWDYDTKKDQTREEANATMDVMHLFRKIQLIELVLGYMVDKNQLILHNLTKPPTLKEVQNQRLCMSYYHSIIRGKFAINVQDIKNNNTSLSQYIKIQSKNSINSMFEQKQQKKQQKEPIGTSTQLYKLTNSVILNQNGNQVIRQEENNRIKLQKEIREKFYLYSGIQDKKVIEGISMFPEIAEEARKLKLLPQMEKIEQQLAQIYYELSPEIRQKIINRIPLKILHRLVNCIQKKQKKQIQMTNSLEMKLVEETEKEKAMRHKDKGEGEGEGEGERVGWIGKKE